MYSEGYDSCLRSENADLWQEIHEVINVRCVTLNLVWVKAHCDSPELVSPYPMSYTHILGNELADRLANRAAEAYEVAYQDSIDLLWYYSTIRKIQARLLVIISHIIPERTAVPAAPPRVPRQPSTPVACAVFSSQHCFYMLGPSMHCYNCFQQAPRPKQLLLQWLAAPCRAERAYAYLRLTGEHRPVQLPASRPVNVGRRTLHSSHSLAAYRGLIFCTKCGYYAHHRALHLADRCTWPPSNPREVNQAINRVRNLRRGILPGGVRDWPNSDAYRQIALA